MSFVSKEVEKNVQNQYMDHCLLAMLNSYNQSAYKEGYSCETALFKTLNELLCSMEHQKLSALVFLDLSVAFKTVDHGILLEILEKKFGIRT